jgi:WD40 repeat protein
MNKVTFGLLTILLFSSALLAQNKSMYDPYFGWDGDNGEVYSVTYNSDGKLIASGGEDNMVKLWEAETGKLIKVFSGHKDKVKSVKFSPDGLIMASGGEDNTVILWNVNTGEKIHSLSGHTDFI